MKLLLNFRNACVSKKNPISEYEMGDTDTEAAHAH